MKRRFLAQNTKALASVADEVRSLQLDFPHEVVIQPFRKRISDDKRAVLHILLRALADHTGYSIGGLKAVLAQDGEWPIEVVSWKGKDRRVRKETMDLTDEECRDLIVVVERYCIDMGVQLDHGNWEDDT